jgi:heme-degrading monooxygenase HmoA
MAVLYIYESPDATLDVYDRVSEQIRTQGVPPGALSHVACPRDGGGLVVVEVWETEEAHDRFAAALEQRIAEAGGPQRPRPRKLPVHHMMTAEKTTTTV